MRRYIEIDADGICYHEFEHHGPEPPGGAVMDVTARQDGPWLGKKYDKTANSFAWRNPTAKLTVSSSSIAAGEKVTLTCETSFAEQVSLLYPIARNNIHDQGIPVNESVEVEKSPTKTTTYTLRARGRTGTTTATVRKRVTVRPA